MFTYQTVIHLEDTDATGALYFAAQFNLALRALEGCLIRERMSLGRILRDSMYLMPIVHAEADYFSPLRVGDEVEIQMSLLRKGTSSFTLRYLFRKGEVVVGTVSLVHVTVSRETQASIPIPEEIQALLHKFPAAADCALTPPVIPEEDRFGREV